jgi:23S rRNA pseudouridine1911/1915/1917 synthase
MLRIEIDEDRAGRRLDVVVAEGAGVSRSRAGELVGAGAVSVGGRVERKSYRVAPGDVIDVAPADEAAPVAPEGIRVLYSDEHVLVVEKPAGVVVHTAPGLREGTMVDALVAAGHPLAARAGEDRPGIVHRLDRDVSGVLVVAKTDEAHEALAAAMSRREIERTYAALVVGVPSVDRGKIDAPIARNPRHPTRMAVLPEGRPSVTWFRVIEKFETTSLLEVRLETGRTHQIRTHLAAIGHPVIGDSAYGRDPSIARSLALARPFLHARKLAFAHPISGDRVEVESDLPGDLQRILDVLRTS